MPYLTPGVLAQHACTPPDTNSGWPSPLTSLIRISTAFGSGCPSVLWVIARLWFAESDCTRPSWAWQHVRSTLVRTA